MKIDEEHAKGNSLIHQHVLERDRITLLQGYGPASALSLSLFFKFYF